MLFSELIDTVKIESGEFEIDFEEISTENYKRIFEKQVVPIITKHIPYAQNQRIEVAASPYTFTSAIPDWISEVNPIDLISPVDITRKYFPTVQMAEAITKDTFIWNYNKPKLYVEFTGTFNILSLHSLELQDASPNDFEILYMNDAAIPHIIDLMAGFSLIAVGRSRRKAKITDIPIDLDGSDLVVEGREQVNKVKEEIGRYSQWWLAV